MIKNDQITRVALYARVSTEEQTENFSLAGQVELLRKYAKENKFEVVDEYVDGGFSGTTIDRPAFQRLIEDAKLKKFQLILVYRVDRFFRNNKALLTLTEDLEKIGIFIRSLTEPFDTSTHLGKFVLSLFGSIAQLERDTFLERSKMGRIRRAREGFYSGSQPTKFGYKYNTETKKLEIEEKEAEIIKLVFRDYIQPDSSLLCVARKLNNAGYTTKTGGKFRSDTIHDMVRDTSYIGKWYANRYTAKGERPKEEWIEVPVPRIVDDEIFEQAQRVLKSRRNYSKRNAKNEYLLQGLIRCGDCDSTVGGTLDRNGTVIYKNGKPYGPYLKFYYRCNHAYKNMLEKKVVCKLRWLDAERLENSIWAEVEKILTNPELITKSEEYKKYENGMTKKELESQLEKLTLRQKNIEQEEHRMLEAYKRNIITADQLQKELTSIRTEQHEIESEGKIISEQLTFKDNSNPINAIEFIKEVKKGITCFNYETKKAVLKMFHTHVIANIDGVMDVTITIPVGASSNTLHLTSSFLPSFESARPTFWPLAA